MEAADIALLWLLFLLALTAAILRILLANRKGQPLAPFWRIQAFAFPALLFLALAVWYAAGRADAVFPALALGLAEELLCTFLRRRGSGGDRR